MNTSEFMSLGRTKQLAHINNLEALNIQKTEMIKQLTEDNTELITAFKHYHVNDGSTDACSKCGFDLRNPIHIL